MNILTLCGSSSETSQNRRLLHSLTSICSDQNFIHGPSLTSLPLYSADDDHTGVPDSVLDFRKLVRESEAVIISTPEYLKNIPAVLKNSFEWLKSGGELQHKKVVAISFTPEAPRGEKAMTSLLNTLIALESRVVCSLPLYANQVQFDDKGQVTDTKSLELLKAAIMLLPE